MDFLMNTVLGWFAKSKKLERNYYILYSTYFYKRQMKGVTGKKKTKFWVFKFLGGQKKKRVHFVFYKVSAACFRLFS